MRPGPLARPERLTLPPPPRELRGRLVRDARRLTRWAGASGPFWRVPAAVLRPRDAAGTAAALAWSSRHGIPLVPRGGGTGMPGGNVGPWVILDLSDLGGVAVEGEAGEPVLVRAGAGVRGTQLEEAAREHGHEFPALPSSAPWCTLGGMLACNAAGARSLRHGAVRSAVREVDWVRSDGRVERLVRGAPLSAEWADLRETLRAHLPDPLPWPAVRKNSSGYALDAFLASGDPVDLAVGSEGTLGVVTGALMEASSTPSERALAVLGLPTLADLVEVAALAGGTPGVEACEYLGRRLVELGQLEKNAELRALDATAGLMLVEVAGGHGMVTDALARVREAGAAGGVIVTRDPERMAALWSVRHAANPTLARARARGLRSTQFIEDPVVPVPTLSDFLPALHEILRRHDTDAVLFGHAGDGNLHVNPLVDLGFPRWRDRVRGILEETVALVAALGGTLAGEHGDGRLRTPYLNRIFAPAVVDAFRALKETLDPGGLLNPGVKVPLPGSDPLAGLGSAPGFARGSQGPEAEARGR
ncbi:MAG: FAD-binding oxidoreductase [Longimicrobiales bacterium]|nr:FAD-binding oxidoreductase [Longimicrobiales bacterium]